MSSGIHVLEAAERGDANAAAELFPLVYSELRQVAGMQVARESPGQSFNATALVHEAYLRLVGNANEPQWQSRTHFVAAAAEAMRRILIDRARAKATQKRGGGRYRVPLDEIHRVTESSDALLALDEVLNRLAAEEPIKAELVKMRFFGGLTMSETATALGVSLATAERWWAYARSWLYVALAESDEENVVVP